MDKDNPGYTEEKKQNEVLNKKPNANQKQEEKGEEQDTKIECKEISLRELSFDAKKNYVILLRNDGSHFNTCHYKIYIPPCLENRMVKKHPFDYIDSLNSSVILGLLLSSFKIKNEKI